MSEETRREFLRTTGQSLAATALAFALTDPRRASQVASAAEGGQVGIQQAPVRGASIVASGVLSHSGEFSSRISDLAIPGRGLSFQFERQYRSGLNQIEGPFGKGWTCIYAQYIERVPNGILYHDGLGRVLCFKRH